MPLVVGILIGVVVTWGWLRVYPVQIADAQLQGHWRLVEVNGENRERSRFYVTVSGAEAQHRQFDADGGIVLEYLTTLDSRVPDDVLLGKSTNDARQNSNSFYWRVRGDTLTEIRGVASGDRIHTPSIYTFERVDRVPAVGTIPAEAP